MTKKKEQIDNEENKAINDTQAILQRLHSFSGHEDVLNERSLGTFRQDSKSSNRSSKLNDSSGSEANLPGTTVQDDFDGDSGVPLECKKH